MLTGGGLAAVFDPRRVALVGASDRVGSVGRLLWDNLADFPGEVLPVCQAATVGGRPAYPDLRDVPGEVDLAVIATPAATVPDIIAAAAAKGVTAVVVLSAGFAETGPAGAKLQAEAVAAARAGGVRLVGPNCFGVQNADLPLNASISAGAPRGGGGVSIVTQSGSYGMAVHALGRDEGLRVAKVFAAGNKADITDAELLGYLREDPATSVICLLLESITDARGFFAEACRTTPVKPVIAVVHGRTGAGQRAAVSHTAALATDDAVRDAALRQAGVARVRTGLQALDAARALSGQPLPRGPRVAVVTNSGGTGVELADLLADEGLEVPELSGRAAGRTAGPAARLRQRGQPGGHDPDLAPVHHAVPGHDRDAGPLRRDRRGGAGAAAALGVGGSRGGGPGRGGQAARRRGAGAGLCLLGGAACRGRAREPAAGGGRAVLPVAGTDRQGGRRGRSLWHAGRAAAEPQRGVAAGTAHGRRSGPPPPRPSPQSAVPVGRGLLPPDAARELLTAAGIPVIETVLCDSAAMAVSAAARLGYPVVAKVAHPALTHKSDVGGVRLGLFTADAVRSAAADLLALADGAAVLVQPQREGIELVIGGVRDPDCGPVIMTGFGGVLVEARRDVQLAVAPVDEAQAGALLRSLRGAAVFTGLRGRPPVDLGPVAAMIVAVGDLMAGHPEISELDLNPVLVGASASIAVDWRILAG